MSKIIPLYDLSLDDLLTIIRNKYFEHYVYLENKKLPSIDCSKLSHEEQKRKLLYFLEWLLYIFLQHIINEEWKEYKTFFRTKKIKGAIFDDVQSLCKDAHTAFKEDNLTTDQIFIQECLRLMHKISTVSSSYKSVKYSDQYITSTIYIVASIIECFRLRSPSLHFPPDDFYAEQDKRYALQSLENIVKFAAQAHGHALCCDDDLQLKKHTKRAYYKFYMKLFDIIKDIMPYNPWERKSCTFL